MVQRVIILCAIVSSCSCSSVKEIVVEQKCNDDAMIEYYQECYSGNLRDASSSTERDYWRMLCKEQAQQMYCKDVQYAVFSNGKKVEYNPDKHKSNNSNNNKSLSERGFFIYLISIYVKHK